MATTSRRQHAIKNGYRSGLEDDISKQLKSLGVPFKYEELKISYDINETRTYTPDFQLDNGIIIESKGRFVAADRKKHLLIQYQLPKLDIRFVFSNSKGKINKGSNTTYGMWCAKYGFQYWDKEIPQRWIEER